MRRNPTDNWYPPPDSQRPKHLRGFDLIIDPMHMPERMADTFAELGVDVRYDLRAMRDDVTAERRELEELEAQQKVTLQ